MFKHTTVKKSLILLVAALLAVAVLLSACGTQPFKPNFDAPKGETVTSNGGIAVKYGDWIYYVNGYESSASAENTYVDTNDAPRIGSVVRISVSKLAEILAVNDDNDLTSSQKTDKIEGLVRDNAEIVVPKIYFSANTTTAQFNGIYIFNDRLYILTPNDKLTAGGNPQTDQSVLMSFDLNGDNAVSHFTFTSNSVQVKLYEKDNKVMATYLLDNQLHVLNVADGKDTQITADDETVSSVNFVEDGDRVFYINNDGAICQLVDGQTSEQVVVHNNEDWEVSYSISSVANTFVYYTVSYENNSSVNGTVLYYAEYSEATTLEGIEKESDYQRHVALNTANVSAKGWKENKVVIVRQTDSGYYGMYVITSVDGTETTCLLKPGFNSDSITINKIVGDDLYYTAGGVTYKKNLVTFDENKLGQAYGTALSTTPTGWALPDIVIVGEHTYVFTFGTGSVSVVEFDAEKKTNSTSATLTLTANED